MKPATSVVLATCEGSEFLEPLLASLAGQRVPPAELVVSDDASTDATLRIVDAFAAGAPFPVVVLRHEDRVGHAENFLRGLAAARGEFVGWCDQDDVWLPNKLAWCQAALRATRATLVIHGARRVDREGRPLGSLRGVRAPVQRRLRGERFAVPHGFRQVFRRCLFDGITAEHRPRSVPGDELALHDEWSYLLAHAAGTVLWLPLTLVDYRSHGGNLSEAGVEPTIWQRTITGRRGDPNALRARSAGERAEHLEQVASRRAGAERDVALRSAAAYRRAAATYEARRGLYEQPRRRDRLRRAVRLAADGGYRSGATGGLGPRGLLRDAVEVLR